MNDLIGSNNSKYIKVFIISLVAVFLMVVIPKLGIIKSPSLVKPVPSKIDIMDQIRLKLLRIENNYRLNSSKKLISEAFATGEFENAISFIVSDYNSGVTSNRGGKKLSAVLLGAPGVIERDLWASALLDAGYQKKYGFQPVNINLENLQAKYSTWKYWN